MIPPLISSFHVTELQRIRTKSRSTTKVHHSLFLSYRHTTSFDTLCTLDKVYFLNGIEWREFLDRYTTGLVGILYSRAYNDDLKVSPRSRYNFISIIGLRFSVCMILIGISIQLIVLILGSWYSGANPMVSFAFMGLSFMFATSAVTTYRRLNFGRILIRISVIVAFMLLSILVVLSIFGDSDYAFPIIEYATFLLIVGGFHWSLYRISYHPYLLGYPDNPISQARPDILDSW